MKFIKNTDIFRARVKDFWWRIEFQNKGSPHLHMVIWLENYPSFEGIQLVDKVCSCQLPSEVESELRRVLNKCQTHRHTAICKKNSSFCRFYIPRQECEQI